MPRGCEVFGATGFLLLPCCNIPTFLKTTLQQEAFVKVTSADLLKRFQNLLDKSHKSMCNYTRDRNWASGAFIPNTPVPTGYELVGAVRNENTALWRIYQVSKEVIRLDCMKPLKEAPFKTWTPLTMEAGKGLDWSDFDFCGDANEWLLFHASIPEALSAIARTGFTMAKLGSGGTTGGGGLYGDGTYFGDSITKADEYARRKVEHGEFKGCRAAAICRVLGGRPGEREAEVCQACPGRSLQQHRRRSPQGEEHLQGICGLRCSINILRVHHLLPAQRSACNARVGFRQEDQLEEKLFDHQVLYCNGKSAANLTAPGEVYASGVHRFCQHDRSFKEADPKFGLHDEVAGCSHPDCCVEEKSAHVLHFDCPSFAEWQSKFAIRASADLTPLDQEEMDLFPFKKSSVRVMKEKDVTKQKRVYRYWRCLPGRKEENLHPRLTGAEVEAEFERLLAKVRAS
eukprot:symbB.v1.2.031136.t2/scaffold3581.1/size55290/5